MSECGTRVSAPLACSGSELCGQLAFQSGQQVFAHSRQRRSLCSAPLRASVLVVEGPGLLTGAKPSGGKS
jgi:hypothetical protein